MTEVQNFSKKRVTRPYQLSYVLLFLISGCISPQYPVKATEQPIEAQRNATARTDTPDKQHEALLAAIKGAKPGDTITLQGEYLGQTTIRLLKGTADKPIVLQAVGKPAVFDGGLPFFRELNKNQWERVPKEENPAPDEWQSTMELPSSSYRGQFLDTRIRLLTYSTWEDFRASNETWGKITDANDPRPGPEVFTGKGVSAKYRLPWTYYGPGLMYNETTKRLHIRLSHTHHGVIGRGIAEYEGETNPNALRLAVTAYENLALDINNCQNLIFRNVIVQNGGNWLGGVESNQGLTFDHCQFFPGTYPLRIGPSNKNIKLLHCLHDGGIPPWSFRSEFKDNYNYKTPDGKLTENNQVRKTQRTLLMFEAADSEIAYNEFRHGHDLYLNGVGDKFHHNLVEEIHDDSLFVSANSVLDIDVYQNVFRRGLTTFSFAGKQPGKRRFFYRNLIDMREPTVSYRPNKQSPNTQPDLDAFRSGNIFKMNDPVGSSNFYQNTFLTRAEDIPEAFALSGTKDPLHPRFAFNNIFLSLNPNALLATLDRPEEPVQSDGNLWFRFGDSSAPLFRFWPYGDVKRGGTFKTLDEYRASPMFEATKKQYPPGTEASSLQTDPKFAHLSGDIKLDDDFRLAADSPARGAGVELPADWPDPLRPKAGIKPDIGALPYGAEALKVGVDGRFSFPGQNPD